MVSKSNIRFYFEIQWSPEELSILLWSPLLNVNRELFEFHRAFIDHRIFTVLDYFERNTFVLGSSMRDISPEKSIKSNKRLEFAIIENRMYLFLVTNYSSLKVLELECVCKLDVVKAIASGKMLGLVDQMGNEAVAYDLCKQPQIE
jgi:hypothetical protein